MRFAPRDTLTEEEVESGLKAVIKDGLTSQAMGTLTGGAFLVAFALSLGASYLLIGIMAAIPFLMQLVQIPTIYLIERYRTRSAISIYASAASRVAWFFVALIPLLVPGEAGLTFLILAILLNSAISAVGGCSWNSWMRDLVPQDRLGAFFSKRMSLAVALSIPIALAAGFYLDYWKNLFPDYELYGYSLLFFTGFLIGMVGVYFVSTIPEPRMAALEERPQFVKMIFQPFKDANFRNLIAFMGSWHFAVNLAAPFFTVYMLVRLNMDMSIIITFLVLSQVMNFLFLRIWGRFSDRFSNKSVLGVSGPMFLVCIFAWTFTTMPEKYVLTIPLLIVIHIFMGISTAGINLATVNIGLKMAPKGQATAYLAANSVVISLAAGTAPILGGMFADFFVGQELSWTLRWTGTGGELAIQTLSLQHWDFFFVLAFLVGLYSIHRLAMVSEVGEVEEKIVIHELVAEVRRRMVNFSTVSGLYQMVNFPYSMLRYSVVGQLIKKDRD